jgi:hypothetical protein
MGMILKRRIIYKKLSNEYFYVYSYMCIYMLCIG